MSRMSDLDLITNDILWDELTTGDLYREPPVTSAEYNARLIEWRNARYDQLSNFAGTIASLEGQALYELYARQIAPMKDGVVWAAGYVNPPSDYVPRQWKDLTPTQKGFWQLLAQDFLKVAK